MEESMMAYKKPARKMGPSSNREEIDFNPKE